jgi:eukaryotic-like serine/threonine-protein kinase
MTDPFTNALGDLRVERTIENHPSLPCVEAIHPDGRRFRARSFAFDAAIAPEAAVTFDEQAAAASRLLHPSISPPLLWSAGAPCYVAYAPIRGQSLDVHLHAETGPLPSARAIAVGVDIAQALEVAHAAQVVHGGVGLSAIVISGEGRAVLTDWAISRLVSALVHSHSHLLGSAAQHLAPEQLESARTTSATDVFALGATLYRLLTGVFPFDAPSPLGMTIKLGMGTFDPVESVAPNTPEPLCNLIRSMLAPQPRDRPSARYVAIELENLARDEEQRRKTLRDAWPAEAHPESERAPAQAWVPNRSFDDAPTELAPPPEIDDPYEPAVAPDAYAPVAPPPARESAPRMSRPAYRNEALGDGNDRSIVLWIAIGAGAIVILGLALWAALALGG